MSRSGDPIPPTAPRRPVLAFDGRCGFCARSVDSWRSRIGDAVEFLPAEDAAARFPSIPPGNLAAAVQLIQPDGRVLQGAAAIYAAFASGNRPWLWRIYRRVPGFSFASEAAYRFIARHRESIGARDLKLFGEDDRGPKRLKRWQALYAVSFAYPVILFAGATTTIAVAQRRRRGLLNRLLHRRRRPTVATRWLFLRALGVGYLSAFTSLLVQVRGLAGKRGILPAPDYLEFLRRYHGRRRHSLAPTLLWANASDRALVSLCRAGAALSILLVIGVAPLPVLALLWASYLSLAVVCQDFLQFQWDALLLEAGLLAMLDAPLQLRPFRARESPPSPTATWLLRWLLFRVIFSSGMVKLASRDQSWRAATALEYHYQTQPLPTSTSYYAHQLPKWFHRLSVYGVWLCEVVMPPLGLMTRRLRAAAFVSTLGLQFLIAATGNYGFFNLLTVALALPLLDDDQLPRSVRKRLPVARRENPVVKWGVVPIGAGLFLLGLIPLAGACALDVRWPRRLMRIYGRVAPWYWANPYGLFAIMTTERPELIVEGSDDAATWLPYEFKWKPGDPARRPRFTLLHLPRLDWLMWFAALSPGSQLHWLKPFLGRLLEGSPEVLALLGRNPFPERPPRFARVRVYRYEFASLEERARTGQWWTRELIGDLVPLIARPGDLPGGSRPGAPGPSA